MTAGLPLLPLTLSLSLFPSLSLNLYLKSLCPSGVRQTYRPNRNLPLSNKSLSLLNLLTEKGTITVSP